MSGWIKIHRKILDWEWYSDLPVRVLFVHLLLKVNFEKKRWQGIEIQPGQIITGRKSLSDETGLTEMQVRTALTKLKLTNEITIKTHNKYSIITVVSWENYQDSNQQNNQQATNKQPTNNQQITTTKEYKNIRKKEGGEMAPVQNFSSEMQMHSKCTENKETVSDAENGAYMSFQSIQERMLGDEWIDHVVAAKKWQKLSFKRHVFNWLGVKQLAGTHRDFTLGKLKEFCIRDYKPNPGEEKPVYQPNPNTVYR